MESQAQRLVVFFLFGCLGEGLGPVQHAVENNTTREDVVFVEVSSGPGMLSWREEGGSSLDSSFLVD